MLVRKLMKSANALIVAAVFAIAGPGSTLPASAAGEHVKAGVLTCAAGASIGLLITSSEKINCSFQPDASGTEHYSGRIREFGLDVGVTAASVIVWVVFAGQSGYVPHSLAGEYIGVSAEETVVLGLGANALVGGSNKSIVLQPLSVQAQAGLNLAVGVTRLELTER
jgi:Protein of unknown function (DUF992)